MNMFAAINNDLMRAFNITATQLSNLSAAYLYADMLLLLPAGLILDRFSTRWVLSIAMAVSIIATLFLAYTNHYWIAFMMRLLSGFGASFNLLSSLRLASRWFPLSKLAIVTGAVVTMAFLGGVTAQVPMTYLAATFGWRGAIQIDAAIGVFFLLLIMTIVRDFPKGYKETHPAEFQELPLRVALIQALKNKQTWLSGAYTSFINLPILVFGALWGIQYWVHAHNFSQTRASLIESMLFIGAIVGAPFFGWLSDHFQRRKTPMVWGAVISIILIFTIRYWNTTSFTANLILLVLLGFFTSSQVITYPLIAESNPRNLTATSLGVASVLIIGGGALFQSIMGLMLDWHWNGVKLNGVPAFSVADYQFAFMIFPVMFIIALVCALFINETYCKEKV
jgi:MFS family permease